MANIVNPNLPADLPTDWTTSQYVSPNGSEVSLSQQHGYNYLMEQVNAAQTALSTPWRSRRMRQFPGWKAAL